MRFRAPIIAAVLLASAVALVWLRSEDSRVPDSASAPSVVAEPAVAGASPSDESRPSVPPAPQDQTAAGPQPSPLPGEALTTPVIQLIEDLRAQNQPLPPGMQQDLPRIQARIAGNERAFADEPIDASWAASAEAVALGKIAQVKGLVLVDLRFECRSTMCRLQMAQSPYDAVPLTTVLNAIGLQPQWVVSLGGRNSGSLDSVAYLWREGFAPPPPAMHGEAADAQQ